MLDSMLSAQLIAPLQKYCTQLGFDRTYWVAFSGGMDSLVLLTLCGELRKHYPIRLRAIYVNHGLSPHAGKWADHCRHVCQAYSIDFIERMVHIDRASKKSLEEAAREKRYAVFAEVMQVGDVLLTAHHQDDQAETVLIQLLRGAGPKGLAGMPETKPFALGWHVRPLLSFPREVLLAYASSLQHSWVEDESNSQVTLTRNFLRHQIIPLLKERWPSVAATFSRSAVHCSEAQVLLEEYAVEDWKKVQGSNEGTLSVQKLRVLSSTRLRLVIRLWIEKNGFPLPDTKKLTAIEQQVLTAAWDRFPCVKWKGAEIRRYRDDLYVLTTLAPFDPMSCFPWDMVEPLSIPGIGTLRAKSVHGGQGLRPGIPNLSVRLRRGGEKLCLPNRGCHTLKNLFQEWEVLPWMRERLPLIFAGERLIGVVGYGWDEQFLVDEGLEIICQH